jgi:hypothetical protein
MATTAKSSGENDEGLPSPVYDGDHNPPGPHTNTDWQAESPRRADVIVFRAIESPLNGRASPCFKPIVLRREPGPAAYSFSASFATYAPEAFDNKGDSPNASQTIFASLANVLAPHTLPSQ